MITPGIWRVASYLSGTINVEDGKYRRGEYGGLYSVGPHIRILYRNNGHKRRNTATEEERMELAERIASLLNGDGNCAGLTRTSETEGHSEGLGFAATGPYIGCVIVEEDPRFESARAKLLDRIFGVH